MKKLITICAVVTMMLLLSSSVQAGIIQIDVQPGDVPDETQPRVNVGDAPTGFGPDSWQGPVAGAGNKTNWHARYQTDGDALSLLFPTDAETMTISDLAEISYFTKRPNTLGAGQDWWLQIYTRPTGSGDKSSWYHDRYINNYSSHTSTDAWTQYSTNAGSMTFQSNGWNNDSSPHTLAGLQADHGSDLIEMISVQTNSGWNGFDGYMDGLEITLANGNVGQVNFVPEPVTMSLLALGSLGLLRRRKN